MAIYPDDCGTADELFGNADLALYRAKAAGRGRYVLFERKIRDELEARLLLEAELVQAVARCELELFYQPQVSLKDGALSGAEALIRWRHPIRGLVPPADFMPLVNSCTISDRVALWVMETACAQGRSWQQKGYDIRLGVNLSPSLLQSAVVNPNGFGVHLITVSNRYLSPVTVQNDQTFGSNAVNFALKSLAPAGVQNVNTFGSTVITKLALGVRHVVPIKVANGNQFGAAQVRVSRRYLVQAKVTNTQQFGAQRVHFATKLLAQTKVTNATQFGAPTVAVAVKSFSYSNLLGSGDRTGTLTVTTSGGSTFDSPSRLVNGNLTENIFWGFGAITFKFDLGSAKVIRQARWRQDTSTTHSGLFQWQGSNDDATYTDIGGTFNLGGAPISLCNTLINNTTAHRYYRLVPTAGASISGTPYLREVEFYIEGNTKDQPDLAYTFPCGGGANAGGQSAGTGGNGVSRTSLINVTASFSPAAGTLAKLIDGQTGFSGSTSLQIPDGLTNAVITFDFQPSGKKHIVTAIEWEQSNATSQGNNDWEASNDGTNWTTLKANFSLVNGSSANETTWTSTTPYRYHRLKQVSGTTSSSPWVYEIYFKCAPSAYAADAI